MAHADDENAPKGAHMERFNRLLKAMSEGEAPSAQKSTSGDPALGEEPDACSSDTQTPRDTSGDASR